MRVAASFYHPLNFTPNAAQSVVSFSTTMQIVDSDNGFADQFGYTVYNTAGQQLFALIFDNSTGPCSTSSTTARAGADGGHLQRRADLQS